MVYFCNSEANATVNDQPAESIAIYRVALNYGLRFPLHPVIEDILNKYELAPTQVVPMSWYNICSFITTCELHGLTLRPERSVWFIQSQGSQAN